MIDTLVPAPRNPAAGDRPQPLHGFGPQRISKGFDLMQGKSNVVRLPRHVVHAGQANAHAVHCRVNPGPGVLGIVDHLG